MSSRDGFTLVELVLVIVIIGIIATAAIGTGKRMMLSARTEETRREMDHLAEAIVGNAELQNNGVRCDFGYVGDVGSLPPNLTALQLNPGGLTTWRGPYLSSKFTGAPNDVFTDAWGTPYQYTGLTISSTGGEVPLTRQLAGSSSQLLYNSVSGTVVDADGSPPGLRYDDSISAQITFPDGTGGYRAKFAPVTGGGLFRFDSIPIGNQTVQIVYEPAADSITRFVSVTPASNSYAEYRLSQNYWVAVDDSGLVYVPGSDSLSNSIQCNNLSFWITNNASSAVSIDYIIPTWSSPSAWYREVIWGTTKVINQPNSNLASGDTAWFSSPMVIGAGQNLNLQIRGFNDTPGGGGSSQSMANVEMLIRFSDGTQMTVPIGDCQ